MAREPTAWQAQSLNASCFVFGFLIHSTSDPLDLRQEQQRRLGLGGTVAEGTKAAVRVVPLKAKSNKFPLETAARGVEACAGVSRVRSPASRESGPGPREGAETRQARRACQPYGEGHSL